ncbi:MAG: response regulator transcription factor [Oscillochloris sp.]|nr:response regulator transcription factor [Oscillochloris sp.]
MPHAYHVLVGGLGNRIDEFLVSALTGQGYQVRQALGLPAILADLGTLVDLVLLDLPNAADLSHLPNVRAACTGTLIVIGPARNERLLIEVLEQGADDYVQRPFRTDELLARVRAQLRRRPPVVVPPLQIGTLSIDLAAHQVRRDNLPIRLSVEEYTLLAIFAAQPGFRYSVEYLIEQVWGRGHAGAAERIDGLIEQLRTMLGDNPLAPRLIPGDPRRGYWLEMPRSTATLHTTDE